MKIRWSLSACVLALLAFSPTASATNEFEPNDSRDAATGPLEGGKWYSATFETENDEDWYVFYVKTYSQMDFSATMTKSCLYNAYLTLRDLDGEYVGDFVAGDVNQTLHLLLTLNPGRYYLEVDYTSACPKDTYKFRIDPAAAITANRDCGEAIVAKDALGPKLAEVNGKLSENGKGLAEVNGAVSEAKTTIAGLNGRWSRFLAKWKAQMLRLNRRPWSSGYAKRRRRAHLVAIKRRTNRRIQAAKAPAKRELAAAKGSRAKVVEERAGLQALKGQHSSELSQAEGTIAVSC